MTATEQSPTQPLVHCIYTSASTVDFSREDILALLEKARKVNAGLDVTGMLLYSDGSFFQILEGEPEKVKSLYEKISADQRHKRITKIIFEPIEERSFSNWTMGYSEISRKELSQIEGMNDFFLSGKCYTDIDAGRAKKLLSAFKQGQWRATLDMEAA